MYSQVNRSKNNCFPTNRQESWAIANAVTRKKCGGNQCLEFVDNRNEAVDQRKLQEIPNNSRQEKQVVQLQAKLTFPLTKAVSHSRNTNNPSYIANNNSIQCMKQKTSSSLVMQLKSVTNENMSTVAERFHEVADRQTVAIVKAGDNFKCYPQNHTSPIKEIADEYDNLTYIQQYVDSGVHAEVSAINQEDSIASIATSREHCPRCEAVMDTKGITKKSSGGNYTEKWVAPNEPIEIKVENTYPAKASDADDGVSGKRYIRDSSNKLSQVAHSVWSQHHDKW
jgi:hypothetical protein